MSIRVVICCLLFSLNAAGQGQDSIVAGQSQGQSSNWMAKLRLAQEYLDSAAQRKVDPHYIEVPAKPWRVILRYKENAVDVDYSNTIEVPENSASLDWKLSFQPPMASSVGFWVGYRGTGLSISKSLAKNAGRYYSFSTTGAKYGFNFRYRRFNTSTAVFDATNYKNGNVILDTHVEGDMPSPVWIRSAYLNGYYVFNGRRYSQAAAYNQSVIQRRSSGSFLAGATWYQSSFDYSDVDNTLFMLYGNNVGKIKVHQANIGFGYGYNWVPLRGLVVNAMAMPTLSVYNRVKIYKYDFNYVLPLYKESTDDYGEWNSATKTWANGKTHRPLPMEDDTFYPTDVDRWQSDSETEYSMLRFNVDLRIGIAYNWSNYFIGTQAQYNGFSYKKDQCKVVLFDAYARVALGMRF